MLVVYDSAMGKTENFVQRTGLPSVKIHEGLIVDEPFVLVTYTINHGQVPESTSKFLTNNHDNMIGVASSGHRNWGKEKFGRAGTTISEKYGVPLILKFQMRGMPSDIEKFIEGVREINGKSIIS
jgi:protein involved in ribonucleotide reduction